MKMGSGGNMKVVFESEYRKEYAHLLEQVFDSGFLSQGKMQEEFEKLFAESTGLECAAVSNGGAALLMLFEYAGVCGGDVLVPANTFWATTVAVIRAGGRPVYVDCNRDDLCMSLEDLKTKVTPDTRAVCVTHIGGHIAFEITQIAEYCSQKNIVLIEDCAHAHGAGWNGKTAGSWGLGGAYSFYATKTMPLGEGGMLVSRNSDFIQWVKRHRNYGKAVCDGKLTYPDPDGFNFRMNEVTAALGIVQLRRLPEILEWKAQLARRFDRIFERRVRFPEGMVSGYYKYIVFDYDIAEETGKVFDKTDFGNEIQAVSADIPNAEWIADHHQCVPIWYGWEKADLPNEELKKTLGVNGNES